MLLLTGPPGVGKTTCVIKLLSRLRGRSLAGFYTRELRGHGARRGFELVSVGGRRSTLCHVDFQGPRRVGRYGVDVEGFERFIGSLPTGGAEVVIIDEIGKMECMSPLFRRWTRGLLASGKTVVATIGLKGHAFIREVRGTPGARLVVLSEANRDAIVEELLGMLES